METPEPAPIEQQESPSLQAQESPPIEQPQSPSLLERLEGILNDKDAREAEEARERQASGQDAEARKRPLMEELLQDQRVFESQLEEHAALLNVAARNSAYQQMVAIKLTDAAGQFLHATDELMDLLGSGQRQNIASLIHQLIC